MAAEAAKLVTVGVPEGVEVKREGIAGAFEAVRRGSCVQRIAKISELSQLVV